MTATPFDTLKLARALRERGSMSSEQAEGITAALAEAFADDIATKRDLKDLEDRLAARIDLQSHALTINLGGMLVVAVGVMATLFRLL